MTRGPALTAVTALVLVLVSACSDGSRDETAKGGADPLVSYGREGGIRFQSSILVVSREGDATLRSEGCTARFRLGAASWRRLRKGLKRTELSALAGDYPAPSGAADVITETIVVGRNMVRIGDSSSFRGNARQELAPLLGVLGEILAEGERHLRSPGYASVCSE